MTPLSELISSSSLIWLRVIILVVCFGTRFPGVRRTAPNLPKGPLFATEWTKNGGLWGGLGPKGPLFVTKWDKNVFLFFLRLGLGPKGSLSGVPHPPKIESGYRWAWRFLIYIYRPYRVYWWLHQSRLHVMYCVSEKKKMCRNNVSSFEANKK